MSTTSPHDRQTARQDPQRAVTPLRVGRSIGHALGAVVNGLLLFLVNVWPGWEVLPFLTEDTTLVVGVVNASLIVSLAFHLLRVVWAPPRLNALADVVEAIFAVAVTARLLQVFPIDVSAGGVVEVAIRVVLVIIAVAAGIGVVVNLAKLVRGAERVGESRS